MPPGIAAQGVQAEILERYNALVTPNRLSAGEQMRHIPAGGPVSDPSARRALIHHEAPKF